MSNPIWLASDYTEEITVLIREKYGPSFEKKCNVLYEKDGDFVLANRDGLIAKYPKVNYSVEIIQKEN